MQRKAQIATVVDCVMSHTETLCDTTPAVMDFINDLAAASKSPGSDDSTPQDLRLMPGCRPDMGRVFLTSVLSLSKLAHKRELLLQTLGVPAAPSQVSATPAREDSAVHPFSAPVTTDTAVFVRMVLSLRGDPRKKQANKGAHAPASTDDSAFQEAAQLPWWTASSASKEIAPDVVYNVQCVSNTAGQSPHHASAGDDTGLHAIPCRIVLQSKPVSVLPASLIHELALDAQVCETAASVSSVHGRTTQSDTSGSVATEAVPGSCAARALQIFDACVKKNERECLAQLAQLTEALQRLLDQPSTELGGAGERADDLAAERHKGEAACLGKCASALHEWTIDVPIYGVVLCIEDTQATRLERVRRLTTPLIEAVVGCKNVAGGPLGPSTHALAKLHTWCTASAVLASHSSSAPTYTQPTLTNSHVMELCQLLAGHLEEPQSLAPSLQQLPLCAAASHSAPKVSKDPACVVHCQLGVSRSPSVVMLFYMDMFAKQLRAAVAAGAAPTEVFHGILSALVQARHQVQPNICFGVQLLSLWNKLLQLGHPVDSL